MPKQNQIAMAADEITPEEREAESFRLVHEAIVSAEVIIETLRKMNAAEPPEE